MHVTIGAVHSVRAFNPLHVGEAIRTPLGIAVNPASRLHFIVSTDEVIPLVFFSMDHWTSQLVLSHTFAMSNAMPTFPVVNTKG